MPADPIQFFAYRLLDSQFPPLSRSLSHETCSTWAPANPAGRPGTGLTPFVGIALFSAKEAHRFLIVDVLRTIHRLDDFPEGADRVLASKSSEERVVYKRLNSTGTLIQRTTTEAPQRTLCIYIGLDVHKKTISYCVKDAGGQVHREGQIGATRRGSNDFYRLDLRSSAATCETGQGGASADATCDRSGQKEERSD